MWLEEGKFGSEGQQKCYHRTQLRRMQQGGETLEGEESGLVITAGMRERLEKKRFSV